MLVVTLAVRLDGTAEGIKNRNIVVAMIMNAHNEKNMFVTAETKYIFIAVEKPLF